MSDLIERLRRCGNGFGFSVMLDAADEIERLTVEKGKWITKAAIKTADLIKADERNLRLQARVEALEREAFAAGYLYSTADIYRGSKTQDDVDAEFRKWKATEQGEIDE